MIVGVLLAAGKSKRMGCHKLSLPLGNKTIGSYALEAAITSYLDKIIVVTKENDSLTWIPSHFFLEPYKKNWMFTMCEKSILGQAESIKCGLKAAQNMQAQAVIILLADQPFITKDIINRIIILYRKEKNNYIFSCANGVISPPALFHSTQFPLLLQLNGDTGAKKIMKSDIEGLTVPFANEEYFQDIDTTEQYQHILKRFSR